MSTSPSFPTNRVTDVGIVLRAKDPERPLKRGTVRLNGNSDTFKTSHKDYQKEGSPKGGALKSVFRSLKIDPSVNVGTV